MSKKITAVVVGRNDDYSGDLDSRAVPSLLSMLEEFDELIYVDFKESDFISGLSKFNDFMHLRWALSKSLNLFLQFFTDGILFIFFRKVSLPNISVHKHASASLILSLVSTIKIRSIMQITKPRIKILLNILSKDNYWH